MSKVRAFVFFAVIAYMMGAPSPSDAAPKRKDRVGPPTRCAVGVRCDDYYGPLGPTKAGQEPVTLEAVGKERVKPGPPTQSFPWSSVIITGLVCIIGTALVCRHRFARTVSAASEDLVVLEEPITIESWSSLVPGGSISLSAWENDDERLVDRPVVRTIKSSREPAAPPPPMKVYSLVTDPTDPNYNPLDDPWGLIASGPATEKDSAVNCGGPPLPAGMGQFPTQLQVEDEPVVRTGQSDEAFAAVPTNSTRH